MNGIALIAVLALIVLPVIRYRGWIDVTPNGIGLISVLVSIVVFLELLQ